MGATPHAAGSVVAKLSPLTKTITLNGSPRGGGAGGGGTGVGAGATGGSGDGLATSTTITSPSSTHKAKRSKGLF